MKNTLMDLNNHLFAQIERLGDENLTGDELKQEIERTKAVTSVASQIVSNGRLALDAQMAIGSTLREGQLPKMLENKDAKV